jgi:hypothetical protein
MSRAAHAIESNSSEEALANLLCLAKPPLKGTGCFPNLGALPLGPASLYTVTAFPANVPSTPLVTKRQY